MNLFAYFIDLRITSIVICNREWLESLFKKKLNMFLWQRRSVMVCSGAVIQNRHDRLQKLTYWREWAQNRR